MITMRNICMLLIVLILVSCTCAGAVQNTTPKVPKGLTERETQIWLEGYSCGYYDALNPTDEEDHYILNTKSHKFHLPSCNGVAAMNKKNRKDFYGTREMAIAEGYDPCGNCNP